MNRLTPHSDRNLQEPSRREFCRTAAALGAAACGGWTVAGISSAGAEEPESTGLADPATGIIDAHVHVWTPDTKRYPLAAGYTQDDMRPPSFTPQELFAHAGPAGVARIVLIQMSFYGYDNSYMLDCIQQYPGVFSGVAIIDTHQSDPLGQMQLLSQRGVRGFRLFPNRIKAEEFFAAPAIDGMFRAAAEKTGQAMCLLVNPPDLPLVDRLCEKYPDTRVVVDHFGRIGVDGSIREADLANLCRLARHPMTYVKISAYYALGRKAAPYRDLLPMIGRLLDAFGLRRLMWASDCPFQVQDGHQYAPSVALIREELEGASDDDRQWLLRKSAESVYFS